MAKPARLCAPASSRTVTVLWASVTLGVSFTPITLRVNMFVARSTPPLAVAPLSATTTVTVDEPLAFAAGVNVNVPLAAMVGCALKSARLSAVSV